MTENKLYTFYLKFIISSFIYTLLLFDLSIFYCQINTIGLNISFTTYMQFSPVSCKHRFDGNRSKHPTTKTPHFLAHLAKGKVSFCHHLASVVR